MKMTNRLANLLHGWNESVKGNLAWTKFEDEDEGEEKKGEDAVGDAEYDKDEENEEDEEHEEE